MDKMIGYMLTWTTYGTWLQGDVKGYVKDGKVLSGNSALENSNLDSLVKERVCFTDQEIEVVREAILQEAAIYKQMVHALIVVSDHVHLVVSYINGFSIERAVCCYKNAAIAALAKHGFEGKVWTKGYDKRFCFDEESLQSRIAYVRRHGK